MTAGEAVKDILKEQGRSVSWLGGKYGLKYPYALWDRLRSPNICLRTLIRCCSALNYEIVLRPERCSKRPGPGEYIITEAGTRGGKGDA